MFLGLGEAGPALSSLKAECSFKDLASRSPTAYRKRCSRIMVRSELGSAAPYKFEAGVEPNLSENTLCTAVRGNKEVLPYPPCCCFRPRAAPCPLTCQCWCTGAVRAPGTRC